MALTTVLTTAAKSIGIDDALAGPYSDVMHDAASRFAELFPEIYLRLHARKDRRAARLTPQMWAVLHHLAMAGPLTVTECAAHFDRAQSVITETFDALERKGLLERMRDARDRRRTLVWLTDAAQDAMAKERRVLDDERLAYAIGKLDARVQAGLIAGMEALVRACDASRTQTTKAKRRGAKA